ncbi:UPF0481 protein At3g47200 [Populus alba]|uniref:Uncharacterized protein n=1 Tax=Populus alba TaxID=43335 RepID=A0A4U5PTW0_POPAL|nr:UPF0481 protein At3g47200-like [Populus alba]TKS00898.1 hypothetical protein D5086_0000178510 [Populus alba]
MNADAGKTTHDDNQRKGPAFPRVPSTFRQIQQNSDCYDPSVVSIGPYHHGNTKLKEMEKLKETYAREFVKDSKKLIADIDSEVEAVLRIAKKLYPEDARGNFNDEQLAKMMFLDGCFILQFMHCLNGENEDLKMSEQQIFLVKRDLLLLENQLPFEVLISLGKKSSKYQYLKAFLSERSVSLDWSPPPPREEKSGTRDDEADDEPQPAHPPPTRKEKSGKRDDERQPAHLLELLYYKSMYHYSKSNHKKAAKGSRGHCLYYSAKSLKKVGILFGARWTGAVTDVKFKSSIFWGTLKVPPIIIDESAKSLLLNLVAYETSAALDQLWVSSYICFMDSLIDDAKDVKELRSNGIIINYLGADQKVANLFNDMGRSIHDTAAYNDIKMEINKQCESTVKRWVYEWKRTYFSNPWTIITVLAASFGLALTATQTYYTRYPPK